MSGRFSNNFVEDWEDASFEVSIKLTKWLGRISRLKEKVNARTDARTTDNSPWHKLDWLSASGAKNSLPRKTLKDESVLIKRLENNVTKGVIAHEEYHHVVFLGFKILISVWPSDGPVTREPTDGIFRRDEVEISIHTQTVLTHISLLFIVTLLTLLF